MQDNQLSIVGRLSIIAGEKAMKLLIPCFLSIIVGVFIFAVTAKANDFSEETKECLIGKLGLSAYKGVVSGYKQLSLDQKKQADFCFSFSKIK